MLNILLGIDSNCHAFLCVSLGSSVRGSLETKNVKWLSSDSTVLQVILQLIMQVPAISGVKLRCDPRDAQPGPVHNQVPVGHDLLLRLEKIRRYCKGSKHIQTTQKDMQRWLCFKHVYNVSCCVFWIFSQAPRWLLPHPWRSASQGQLGHFDWRAGEIKGRVVSMCIAFCTVTPCTIHLLYGSVKMWLCWGRHYRLSRGRNYDLVNLGDFGATNGTGSLWSFSDWQKHRDPSAADVFAAGVSTSLAPKSGSWSPKPWNSGRKKSDLWKTMPL